MISGTETAMAWEGQVLDDDGTISGEKGKEIYGA
jgi:hypothetical protein